MSMHTVLHDLRQMSVYDFFCPEETRSCPPVLAKRVYDICNASGITTVGQLADFSPNQLREKAFSEELIPYICLKMQNTYVGLNLKPNFARATGAQGRVAAVSVLPTNDAHMNGYKYGA